MKSRHSRDERPNAWSQTGASVPPVSVQRAFAASPRSNSGINPGNQSRELVGWNDVLERVDWNTMKPNELNSAIKKLKLAHKYGRRIVKLLDKGDGKQFRKVGYRDAAEAISVDSVTVSEASARNYASFSRRFTTDELDDLIRECRSNSHCPSFDVVVRLLAIPKKQLRKKLTLQVLRNRWEKRRLGQEMRRLNATSSFVEKDPDSQLEKRNRGRPPKAVSSMESLVGELQDDAVKWRRIQTILLKQRRAEKVEDLGPELSDTLMEDISNLADVLQGFFDYE